MDRIGATSSDLATPLAVAAVAHRLPMPAGCSEGRKCFRAGQGVFLRHGFGGGRDGTGRAMARPGARMRSVSTPLRQHLPRLTILTAAAVILWAAGWAVIGILLTVIG